MRTLLTLSIVLSVAFCSGCALSPIEGDNLTSGGGVVFRGGTLVASQPVRLQVLFNPDTSPTWGTILTQSASDVISPVVGLGSYYSWDVSITTLGLNGNGLTAIDSNNRIATRMQYQYNGQWTTMHMYDKEGIDCLNEIHLSNPYDGEVLENSDYQTCSVNTRLGRGHIYLCPTNSTWNPQQMSCD